MNRTHRIRHAAPLALLAMLAPVAAAEDYFALLEPQAYVAQQAPPPSDAAPIAAIDDDVSRLLGAQALELIPTPEEAPPLTAARDEPAPVVAPQESTPVESAGSLARPIVTLTLDSSADPVLVQQMRRLPESFAIQDPALQRFGSWDAPAAEATLAPARFAPSVVAFAAPAVYSRPLYFEQPNLERYGHHVAFCPADNLTQSAISAAHFFATVPALPYKIGAQPPTSCNYVLGAYRPGSCNPHQLLWPECSLSGITLEGVSAVGLVFLIP